MKIEEFNEIVDETISTIQSTLIKKQTEYNFSQNRLDSFEKAAKLLNTNQSQALLGFLTKHIISLYDMINSKQRFNNQIWDEKINDIICYCCLLKGTLNEDNIIQYD